MKKVLFVLIASICFSGVNFASIDENVNGEKTYSKENIELNTENSLCDMDCPSDDYCAGCLMSTYKTEYCVGQRCRTRTLYKCNVCGDKYWIYHD